MSAHLTSTPILFLLLNLLVVALFVSSNMMPQGTRKQGHVALIISNNKTGIFNDEAKDDSDTSVLADNAASTDDVSTNHAPLHDAPADNFNVSDGHALLHEIPGHKFDGTDAPKDSQKSHIQPQLQAQKTVKHRTNLVRSKSDGIVLQLGYQRTPSELRPAARVLKKAGTFESTRHRRRVRPVVVVADPPEEGQVAAEEVDRKAAEFIGRFYQKMKQER
ncbi:hypothetical protein L7F22_055105 [Adiantum nelumboides]|nr:hypothetical protein [Adiantum nelumboides]